MDDQNKNLILATALSFLVILGWFLLFPPEQQAPQPSDPAATPGVQVTEGETGALSPPALDGQPAEMSAGTTTDPATDIPDAPRVPIETPKLSGSLSLAGGRIDDLLLSTYDDTLDPDSGNVRLLSPAGEPGAYYALHGWAPGAGLDAAAVPGTDTVWDLEDGDTLTPESPVTLRWDSPSGLIFRRQIAVDADYMFTVTQSVENPTETDVRAAPYGFVARHGLPDLANFFILHEGVVAMANGELIEEDYDSLADLDVDARIGARAVTEEDVTGGWIGFTDKYWMTSLIPSQADTVNLVSLYQEGPDIYQTQTVYPTRDIPAGATVTQESRLFAGAKEWETIREYEKEGGVTKFIDSIDWGWFFFLTKPIFAVLHWLNGIIGNMGVAIILLTLCIKALLFPLAYKSYVSMARMKELQPEMEKLKERAGDDRAKLQQEMMTLYREKKVNPAAGCLPLLLQIPIFFSLYKVIFVTIELRHAPFFGPFRDLSAPDPTSLYNLFGLFPWAAPEPSSILAMIFIGILPILLGISMWLQQKLNPAPADATQAMIFAWMPWVFMFMLGGFASGLVVYWIANNTITFTQQYLIMRSHGSRPDVFGNIRSGFKRKKSEAK
ncbi:membrane protein insertase YidC [Tropicimonas sp. IMCC34011]|uniref:membrane protein insertase YidC n=1 Tax=Tropicimonas sp. IMCC34011 TaxID=2248759 RepID=UPI000E22F825|nr:membrane protein insertase YidC [Tropicimonas sp. IMCC34011]